MNISDIEATDLEYFKSALAESRKTFEDYKSKNELGNNEQFDVAIQKSLALFKEQEEREVAIAIEKSKIDYVTPQHEQQMNNGKNNGQNIQNNAVKAVIEKGYSLEQAMMAYSVFEAQPNNISVDAMVQKMVEYLEMIHRSSMYGF